MILKLKSILGKGKVFAASVIAGLICISVAEIPRVQAASGDVVKVRLGGDKSQTRVVVELSQAPRGRLVTREDDVNKTIISLSDISLAGPMSGDGRGLVSGWKVERVSGSATLKLDFDGKAKIARRFILPPADGVGVYRYVVDIVPATGAVAAPVSPNPTARTLSATADAAVKNLFPGTPGPKMELAAIRRSTKKVIVIDAGHGGHDPGAIGAISKEKDVNLAAAKALKARLESTGRYRVIMTRETDSYVDKVARVRIARSADADLFISLHSDSGPNKLTRGASIYTLSESGTEHAAKNAMRSGDWSLPSATADRTVTRILIDLTQRATKNRSATFAQVMLNNIEGSTPLLKSSHRQAGFVVLLATDVPAVLLEMGFITNTEDEKLLNDSGHRAKVMGAVARSIDQYFDNDVRYASFAAMP